MNKENRRENNSNTFLEGEIHLDKCLLTDIADHKIRGLNQKCKARLFTSGEAQRESEYVGSRYY